MSNLNFNVMNKIIARPKNGSLATQDNNRTSNFPTIASLIDDWFFGDIPSLMTSNFNDGMSVPKTNIKETEDSYFVEMAVPGMNKESFEINLDNQMLTVSAHNKEEKEDKTDRYTRREFGYSSFKRSFTLPEFIEESKIKASYNEGILNIELPKKEEAKPKPPKSIKVL
jgi:HSP20 family protein